MRRRDFIKIISITAAAWPLTAHAQQPTMPVIGFFSAGAPELFVERITAFREGLRKEQFVEDRNVTFEFRWLRAEGYERMPQLAAELVARRVDVLVAGGGAAAAAKQATKTIPIVALSGGDPVKRALSQASTDRRQISQALLFLLIRWGRSGSSYCARPFQAQSSLLFLSIRQIPTLKQGAIRRR
jgi:ABC-type uncharacterized transport system substrate-binding protein